jgi:hypothetical protein
MFTRRLCALVLLAGLGWQPAWASQRADFGQEEPSAEARHVADWVLDSADHAGQPFVIVDKLRSRVFVFDPAGNLQGAAPALIGSARGDESVPGIGQRKLSSILPRERTTPAGRFVASLERSLQGDEILWVDYEAAIALHRVISTVPAERRLQRLDSRTVDDRRITYGCINVPVKFFEQVVIPAFRASAGVVYVLPETRPAREVFGSYGVQAGDSR